MFKRCFITMKQLADRLESFKLWTYDIDYKQLAEMGFYYTGYGDKIRCAFCQLELYNFNSPACDPIIDHKRWSPRCPYVLETVEFMTTICQYSHTQKSLFPEIIVNNEHLDFTTHEARLLSYKHWPIVLKELVFDLCVAGFYYTNIGDYVCCYVCGIKVNHWYANDSPMQKHYNFNPYCNLVRLMYNNSGCVINSNDSNTPSAPPSDRPNDGECFSCKCNVVCVALIPCRHLCLCTNCAPVCTTCPVCNVQATGIFRVNIPAPH